MFRDKSITIHMEMSVLMFRFKKFDHRYLRKILIRRNLPKSSIVSLYKKLEMKQAIEMVETRILTSAALPTPYQ